MGDFENNIDIKKRLRRATQVMANDKNAVCYNTDRFITDALCHLAKSGRFSLTYNFAEGWIVAILNNHGDTTDVRSGHMLVNVLCDIILRNEQ
jgi:hypothetical protein